MQKSCFAYLSLPIPQLLEIIILFTISAVFILIFVDQSLSQLTEMAKSKTMVKKDYCTMVLMSVSPLLEYLPELTVS